MKNAVLLGLSFFLFLSCEKHPFEKVAVTGTWVETTQEMDTLVFYNHKLLFDLNRGTELRNGHVLPKYLSGTYSYEVVNDSISLQWMPSSSISDTKYYYKADAKNDVIRIGNFFVDSLSSSVILTFVKTQ